MSSNYKHFLNQVSSRWLYRAKERPLRILETCQGGGESTEIYRQVGCVVAFEKVNAKFSALKERFRDALQLDSCLAEYDLSEIAVNFKTSMGFPILMPSSCADANCIIPNLKVRNCKFDLIDVDPYGSPRPFVQNALDSLDNESILLITSGEMRYARWQPKRAMSAYHIKANEEFSSTQKMFKRENILILGAKIMLFALDRQIGLYPFFVHDYYRGNRGVQRIGFFVRTKINDTQKARIRQQLISDPNLGTKLIASDVHGSNTINNFVVWRFKPDALESEVESSIKKKLDFLNSS